MSPPPAARSGSSPLVPNANQRQDCHACVPAGMQTGHTQKHTWMLACVHVGVYGCSKTIPSLCSKQGPLLCTPVFWLPRKMPIPKQVHNHPHVSANRKLPPSLLPSPPSLLPSPPFPSPHAPSPERPIGGRNWTKILQITLANDSPKDGH